MIGYRVASEAACLRARSPVLEPVSCSRSTPINLFFRKPGSFHLPVLRRPDSTSTKMAGAGHLVWRKGQRRVCACAEVKERHRSRKRYKTARAMDIDRKLNNLKLFIIHDWQNEAKLFNEFSRPVPPNRFGVGFQQKTQRCALVETPLID